MCSRWIIAALLVIVPLTSPNAQQSPSDTRQQIEQLARTFNERYNKQDAAAIAGMFTDDAVRVSAGVGAVNIGPQAIEESFKTQFMLGFSRIDRVIDQVSSLGTDAAIAIGLYQISGLRQSGPIKSEGHWTEIYVRERGVWKIRLLTILPKPAPNAVVAAAMPASPDAGLESKSVRMAAIVAETKNGAEIKNSAEAKSTVEVKSAADAKNSAEAKGSAEAKSTVEVKNTADAKSSAEAKGSTEAKSTVEIKNTADVKNSVEAKGSVEAKSTVDVKNMTVAKNSADAKSGAEAKNSVDGKKSILINIDKEKQEMTVSIDGVQTYEWPVSTGRGGYSTPSGTYTATSMNEIWYSRQWDNAPMPHAIFFMKDGHAIHGTLDAGHLGKPASHGCVRLSLANATTLFALVKQNGLQNTQVVLGGVTPGGEYKGAGPAIAARYYQASPAGYDTGGGYYSQQQARAYYAQPQARAYYAQPQARAYNTQPQLRAVAGRSAPYYAAPQGYYASPQGYYVMPYAPQ